MYMRTAQNPNRWEEETEDEAALGQGAVLIENR